MAKIIDFATHKVKHQKYSNTDIDDFDEFDTWDEHLNFDKVAIVVTCLGVTHWIPFSVKKYYNLTEGKEYLIMYNCDKDEYYILDDFGEYFSPFDYIDGEYVRM